MPKVEILTSNSESAIIAKSKCMEFKPLRRADGSCEFEEYLAGLPRKDRIKLIAVLAKTEQYGLRTAIEQQWVKKLRDGIFELRSRQGSDIQRVLYFHKEANEYVITHGFTKKTDRTPQREISKACRLMREYWEREGA